MGILDVLVETPNWVKLLLWMAVLASDTGLEGIIGFSVIGATIGNALSILGVFFGITIPVFTGAHLLLITICFELIWLILTVFMPLIASIRGAQQA